MSSNGEVLFAFISCAAIYIGIQRLAMYLSLHKQVHIPAPPLTGDLLAALTGIQLAALFMCLTGRPIMSVILALALALLLLVLNRAKEKILHEPLVLADAWLIPQIWKYPEMYLPFLPIKAIVMATGGILICLAALVWLEERIIFMGSTLFLLLLILAALPVCIILMLRYGLLPQAVSTFLLKYLPVSHDAAKDAQKNGALAATLMHPVYVGLMEQKKPDFIQDAHTRPSASRWPQAFEEMLDTVQKTPLQECPHVMLIQLESFCDIREYLTVEAKAALQNSLPNWDKLKSIKHILPTPENAYGAYTMRTEFSKLTGLAMEQLGPLASNPYLLAARQPLWSLARFFRHKGYTTVCLHPYHKGFFGRDKTMPNLGFEHFLSLDELVDLEHFGPYVSDLALGKRIQKELAESDKPVFCFAVTIESHGPWQKGRLKDEELLSIPEQLKNDPLFSLEKHIYLTHLLHMDDLLGLLLLEDPSGLNKSIWAYSDHAPGFGDNKH